MIKFLGLASAALAFAAMPYGLSAQEDEPLSAEAEQEPSEGEKRLARLLEGREAGEPQRCIRVRPSQAMTTIEDTAYVFGRGGTIYVQRTQNPEAIDRNDILVTQRFGSSQLCRLDIAQTVDQIVGFFTGNVIFEDFVPYTRVSKDEG